MLLLVLLISAGGVWISRGTPLMPICSPYHSPIERRDDSSILVDQPRLPLNIRRCEPLSVLPLANRQTLKQRPIDLLHKDELSSSGRRKLSKPFVLPRPVPKFLSDLPDHGLFRRLPTLDATTPK